METEDTCCAPTTDGVPIACTLESSEMSDRLGEWQTVLALATTRSAVPGGIRVTFSADAPLDAIARLAVAEQECCRFFSFAITVDERGIALEARAPDDARPLVEALFGPPA